MAVSLAGSLSRFLALIQFSLSMMALGSIEVGSGLAILRGGLQLLLAAITCGLTDARGRDPFGTTCRTRQELGLHGRPRPLCFGRRREGAEGREFLCG